VFACIGWDFDTFRKGMSRDNSITSIPSQDDYGIIVLDNSFTVSTSNTLPRKDSQNSLNASGSGHGSQVSNGKLSTRSLARAMLDHQESERGLVEGKVQLEESPVRGVVKRGAQEGDGSSPSTRVLQRNAKVPNSECFTNVVQPVMRILEESADEMRGDSAEMRKETKMLIGELERVLSALDKQTEGALTSEFLSNIWSFVDEEHNNDDEEDEEDES
jgi:hypothetical protein